MILRIGASAALLVLLAACGSDSSDSTSDQAQPEVSSGPAAVAPVYIAPGDIDGVNAASDKLVAAAGPAADEVATNKCNKITTEAWVACWHTLLDPLQTSLGGMADEIDSFAVKGYTAPGCGDVIREASTTFAGFETRVTALLAGIDSDARAEQEKAMTDYWGVLTDLEEGYNAPFQAMTAVCYSPEDLSRINASASPSAT